MSLPSEKRLRAAFGDDAGRAVRRLLDGRADPGEYESVRAWFAQCHHVPCHTEQVMTAVNEALGHFGVEAVYCEGHHGSFYYNVHATFTNSGDSYKPEIFHDHGSGRFLLCTFEDYIVRAERDRECFPNGL